MEVGWPFFFIQDTSNLLTYQLRPELKVSIHWFDHSCHTTRNWVWKWLRFLNLKTIAKRLMTSILSHAWWVGTYRKPQTLMDMATIFGRYERVNGRLMTWKCLMKSMPRSLKLKWDVNGVKEPWLLSYQEWNPRNHPTEIEPSGAATCIGRKHSWPIVRAFLRLPSHAYLRCWWYYGPISETRAGKLPQQVISKNKWLTVILRMVTRLGLDLRSWVFPPRLCS